MLGEIFKDAAESGGTGEVKVEYISSQCCKSNKTSVYCQNPTWSCN